MKRYSTVDLRHLEIINLCDGARLGYATDFEFDKDDAQILSLIIGGCNGFFGIGREDDLIIPWRKIECFGEDTILVRLNPNELSSCAFPRPRKNHFRY
jgi:YlmC/YmxH family sporulation protein